MQGKKNFAPKLFVNFRLDEHIPKDNFYRILKENLDLGFVYKETKSVYSHTGRPGIDPVVFFKMVLVGYLENICFDRALERLFQLRLDLLFFIDHDINEPVPDHSTLCKTRKRIPKDVFEKVFTHILQLCVDAGMVCGHTQSIDSAYINANASLDKLEQIKLLERDHESYLKEVYDQDMPIELEDKAKHARVSKLQKDLEKNAELRKAKYDKLYGTKQKAKRRTFSNATHQSKTDPDARIAKKSGKPRMLCYSSMLSTDVQDNVITHISAEHASKRDSRLLIKTVKKVDLTLTSLGLKMEKTLADAGFSSGENYVALQELEMQAYIPLHGTYQRDRPGFKYDGRRNAFICKQGQVLKARYRKFGEGREKVVYRSNKKECDKCPMREGCVTKKGIKEITSTPYKREYERMAKRLKTKEGKKSYALRMQTVEPAFGTLQQHGGLRWINVRGITSAHKVMLMAAAAYNLKKWVKRMIKEGKNQVEHFIFVLTFIIINPSKKNKTFCNFIT